MIQIDINFYSNRLFTRISNDIAAMNAILNMETSSKIFSDPFDIKVGIMSFTMPTPNEQIMKTRAKLNCFKSIIAALQDYMDELIAFIELSKIHIELPQNQMTGKEVLDFVQSEFNKQLMKVSTNQSLNVRKKLDIIFKKEENTFYKDFAKSLFELRNGIEHHKALAKNDRTLKYLKLGLKRDDGSQILSFPYVIEPSRQLLIASWEEVVKFDQGSQIQFEPEQIFEIAFSIKTFLIENMRLEVTNTINEVE